MNRWALLIILFVQGVLLLPVLADPGDSLVAQGSEDLLVRELTSRHPSYTTESLLTIAGGEDELVSRLLVLRLEDSPASLGVSAMRVLTDFSYRDDVRAAFLEDVSRDDRLGLGSVLLSKLDKVPDPDFKIQLAKKSLTTISGKSATSKDFEASPRLNRYKLLLQGSSDNKVKALIR